MERRFAARVSGLASGLALAVRPAGFVLPDHRLTPGAWGHDIAQICPRVSRVLEDGRPSAAVKAEVYSDQ